MNFNDYCKKNDIQLLRDDRRFIVKHLCRFSRNESIALLKGYCEQWLSGMGNCDKIAYKQNMGRKTANAWLLQQVLHKKQGD